MKRLQTPLRRTMTGETLSPLSILHMSTRTYIDDSITEFARLKGSHLALACNLLVRVTVLTFFCCKHCTLPITLEMGKIDN